MEWSQSVTRSRTEPGHTVDGVRNLEAIPQEETRHKGMHGRTWYQQHRGLIN